MPETRVALIGYGEVGHVFARDLLAGGRASISVYDIVFDDAVAGSARIEEARTDGVRPARSAAAVADEAHLIISAVTASSSLDVARQAAGYLRSGQVFLDINSVSPQTMADRVRRHGVRRAAEMREASAMLQAMGLDPSLAMAVAEAQARQAVKP